MSSRISSTPHGIVTPNVSLSGSPPFAMADLYGKPAHPGGRAVAFGVVIAVHIVAGWALLQIDGVRTAIKEASPIFVDLIAPADPPPPPPIKPPPPPPPVPRVIPKPPPPAPIITTRPTPAPAPFVAPPPPIEVPPPAPPAPVVEAPPAPPSPAPPAPAPPAEPKTVPISALRYLDPPAPVYPAASRRLRETGRVLLRALIDKQGRVRQVVVQTSSGHQRLDEAALAAVRVARFQPYMENGEAREVWTPDMPIEFILEDR